MQCKVKRLHHRLISQVQSQCQCSALLNRDNLGPWGKNYRHSKRNSVLNNDHDHKKVLDIEDITSPTKQVASSQLSNTESRHVHTIRTFSNYDIPFIFSHQLTAPLAMADYRYSHTYPVLERVQTSGHVHTHGTKHHRPLSLSNLRSNSATQVYPHTLKPKTVTLGTDTSISTSGARKARCQFCRRQQKGLHHAPVQCELSLKMKWYPSSNTPYFMVQPLQPPTSTHGGSGRRAHHHKGSSKSHKKQVTTSCTCGSGNTIYSLQVPGHNCDIHPFAYSCMTYFQRKAREMQHSSTMTHSQFTMTMPPYPPVGKTLQSPPRTCSEASLDEGANPSRSVMTITDPWSHH